MSQKCQKGKSSKRGDYTLLVLFQKVSNATNRPRHMQEFCNYMTGVQTLQESIQNFQKDIQKWRYHHLGLISLANDQTDRNKRNMYLFGPGVQTSQEGVQNTSSRSFDANMLG